MISTLNREDINFINKLYLKQLVYVYEQFFNQKPLTTYL